MNPLSDTESRVLMADLLLWPSREAKPEWWAFFERRDRYDATDLFDDPETIGGLQLVGPVEGVKNSTIWEYLFDPSQECKARLGDGLVDPTGPSGQNPKYAGEVTLFDPVNGRIHLKRGNQSDGWHPRAVMPRGPVVRPQHEIALQEVADELMQHGSDAPGLFRCARRLVGRLAPQLSPEVPPDEPLRRTGEDFVESAIRLTDALSESVLPIQGPPGTGKTYTAARLIVDQAGKGRKIGVTGPSHAAIENLLKEVVTAAREKATPIAIVKKGDESSDPGLTGVTFSSSHLSDLVASFDVVAGTTWAFANEAMRASLDLLIVDEAGQVSLADAVAVATSADSVVLFGDPMQLPQPTKGAHPGMAALSALEHLNGGNATIPENRGVLLEVSWRLHPGICDFISEQIYDSRLRPHPQCLGQRVDDGPLIGGTGIRWVPIDHSDNRTSSIEEANAVRDICLQLLGRPWTNENGLRGPITEDDILIVTPYNAQLNLIRQTLGYDIPIGTVDMFQGREAAVVLVSLAASDFEDLPRGLDFLLSKNRLNVAISRARAICAVIASPKLLTAQCSTLNQMKLVNTLCRYSEIARQITI